MEFKHLVEMHRKYAGQGVVCITVSVDGPDKKNDALGLLEEKGATFRNYRLDEDQKFWKERFGVPGVPVVFVFDRDGRRAGKLTDAGEESLYEKLVTPLVQELLRAKP